MTLKGILIFCIKLAIAAGLLWLVFRMVEWHIALDYIRTIPTANLFLAFAALNLSVMISCWRLKLYYKSEGMLLKWWPLLRVTYSGLFANIFIPGGVGGDAYRIMMLKREGLPAKQGVMLHLQNRANGLMALILLGVALAYDVSVSAPYDTLYLVALGAIACAAVAGYAVLAPLLLKERVKRGVKMLPVSLLVQACMLASVAILLDALVPQLEIPAYLALTAAAAIAAMLPVTIGGLGLRELTLVTGVLFINDISDLTLDTSIAATIGIMLFALTLVLAFLGLIWWLKKGENITQEIKNGRT